MSHIESRIQKQRTYMASQTPSELARRGSKNKAGKHHLRQVGLGLLMARESRLPLFYRVYPGNAHDSKVFAGIMDEMFGVVCGLNQTKERFTVVIDKGMNGDGNCLLAYRTSGMFRGKERSVIVT